MYEYDLHNGLLYLKVGIVGAIYEKKDLTVEHVPVSLFFQCLADLDMFNAEHISRDKDIITVKEGDYTFKYDLLRSILDIKYKVAE